MNKKGLITDVSWHLDSGKKVFITMPSEPEKADFNDPLGSSRGAKSLKTLDNKVEIYHLKQRAKAWFSVTTHPKICQKSTWFKLQ